MDGRGSCHSCLGNDLANTRVLQGDFSALDVLVAWFGLAWAAQMAVKEMIILLHGVRHEEV